MADGASEGEHRASAARQMAAFGMKPKVAIVVAPPAFPAPLDYLWRWFIEISQGMQGNGWSFPVITWEMLAAWSALMQTELEPREARTLIELGQRRAAVMSEKANGDKGPHNPVRKVR